MSQTDAEIKALSDTLIHEIINAVGLPETKTVQRIFRFFFHEIADRLAVIGVTADHMIATDGFPAASGWMASHWVRGVTTRGAETVPPEGPLLVVSNHSGAYDFLVIPSQLNRKDIKLIASDAPFLKSLPNASDHLYFTSGETSASMAAARGAIRHLTSGGSLLLFGTGLIDPDPAVYPDAEAWIEKWLPSIDLFLRIVPETKVLISITSGIVSPRWAHHPITRLKRIDWQRRRLAEAGQVIEQLFLPGRLYVSPRVSLSPPVSVDELRHESQGDRLLPAVIARGKALLKDHMACVQSLPKE